MQPFETIYTPKRVIACDGGRGAMGHPRVFLNMGEQDFADCPYCSRRFVLRVPAHTVPRPVSQDTGQIGTGKA
jgi:uncharacterized Zn-finger protein